MSNGIDLLRREKVADMLVVTAIAGISLTVAYVTFGVLDSTAEGEVQAYSVGGALAGFLVTASFLWSIFRSLRRSSRELEDLRSQKRTLEQKLIRGAPHPVGFTIEVDEKERIVLAHPEHWMRAGGTLFDFVESYDDTDPDGPLPKDVFPAHFSVKFAPMRCGGNFDADAYYERVIKWARQAADDGWMTPPTFEYVFVGEPPHGVRSLKVAYSQYTESKWSRDDITHRVQHEYSRLKESEFKSRRQAMKDRNPKVLEDVGSHGRRHAMGRGRAQEASSASVAEAPSQNGTTRAMLVQTFNVDVICIHPVLERLFWFKLIDDMSDFSKASTDFSHLLTSTRFLI